MEVLHGTRQTLALSCSGAVLAASIRSSVDVCCVGKRAALHGATGTLLCTAQPAVADGLLDQWEPLHVATSSAQVSDVIGPIAGMLISRYTRCRNNVSPSGEPGLISERRLYRGHQLVFHVAFLHVSERPRSHATVDELVTRMNR